MTISGYLYTPAGGKPPVETPDQPVNRRRARLAEQLIAEDTTVLLSDAQRADLTTNLALVDTAAIKLAINHGLRIQMVRPGDDINELRILRNQDLDQFQTRLPYLKQVADAIHEMQAPVREKLPELDEKERKNERIRLDNRLHDTGLPLVAYRPDPRRALRPGAQPPELYQTHVTLEQMAKAHGAETREQIETFAELVKAINGDRVREGAMDPLEHTILLPKLFFYKDLVLDGYDYDAVSIWHGESDRIVDHHQDAEAFQEANGQWFPGVNRILIRDRCLKGDGTAIHELAHGLEILVQREDPQWHKEWKERIERALYDIRQTPQKAITPYSRTNAEEYIAEGVAYYYREPERLKQTDPKLYGLVDQLIDKVCKLGGVDRVLERAHLEQLQSTQSQLLTVIPNARENPEQATGELTAASKQLRSTATTTALQTLQFGLLAGAVDAVLHHVLKQELDPQRTEAQQKATTLDPVEESLTATEYGQTRALQEEFEHAYLAGAALGYKVQLGLSQGG